MKRAFTLIELLVVIAIIAILAAILFPVFAQAKVAAKKAKSLTEIKQMGTATVIYQADYDDLFPRGFGRYSGCANGGWCMNYYHDVPGDWRSTNAAWLDFMNGNPVNSTNPYRKNNEMTKIDGRTSDPYNGYVGLKAPAETGYTYNGLLASYSGTAVTRISNTPMWTSYWGNLNFKGANITSPSLYCADGTSTVCNYVPERVGCNAGVAGGNGQWTVVIIFGTQAGFGSHHVFGNGENWVYTDSSAKFKKLGMQKNGASDFRNDPYTRYDNQARPGGGWYDTNYCHMYSFAPDWDGTVPANPTEEVWY